MFCAKIQPMKRSNDLLTIKQAAKLYHNLPETLILKWITDFSLPAVKHRGAWRIFREDLIYSHAFQAWCFEEEGRDSWSMLEPMSSYDTHVRRLCRAIGVKPTTGDEPGNVARASL